MRIFSLALVLIAVCAVSIEASPATAPHTDKRFWGSIGDWINDNIVKPVEDHVINPIVDVIVNPVIDAASTAINAINDAVNDNIISPIQAIINGPQQPPVPAPQDLCATTCVRRFTGGLDFFLDRPNGCAAKGFTNGDASLLDGCCDQHSGESLI
jgi:hypothetical protein